jgi:hypothetical protein
MLGNRLSLKLAAYAASGAIAFTSMAGTGLARSTQSLQSFNLGGFHNLTLGDFCDDWDDYSSQSWFRLSSARDLCGHVRDFEDDDCDCTDSLRSLKIRDLRLRPARLQSFDDDCRGTQGFNVGRVRGFADAFEDLFGGVHSASVNANADTSVNNTINAGSANDVNVSQDGGLASADVDANANTDVNNEINAFSENNVNVDQN